MSNRLGFGPIVVVSLVYPSAITQFLRVVGIVLNIILCHYQKGKDPVYIEDL